MVRTRVVGSVAVIALVLLAATGTARAAAFAGVYASEKVTVTLRSDGGSRYSGTIRKGGRDYPLTAAADGDRLDGTFRAGDTDYPFQATLDGTRLTVVSGNTTYVCTAGNPMDAADAGGGGGAARGPGNVVGKWAISGDLGGDKFSVTFGKDGTVTVETADGSSASGTGYKYADGKVVFDGSSQMNALVVGGTWATTWTSADAFTTVDARGKTLSFQRVKGGT